MAQRAVLGAMRGVIEARAGKVSRGLGYRRDAPRQLGFVGAFNRVAAAADATLEHLVHHPIRALLRPLHGGAALFCVQCFARHPAQTGDLWRRRVLDLAGQRTARIVIADDARDLGRARVWQHALGFVRIEIQTMTIGAVLLKTHRPETFATTGRRMTGVAIQHFLSIGGADSARIQMHVMRKNQIRILVLFGRLIL